MSSLRARVLLSVLALAAAGMVAVGAVTYAEQRSFLEGRSNDQARSAVASLSQLLDRANLIPRGGKTGPLALGGGQQDSHSSDESAPPAGRGGLGLGPLLPPGTYGQRREASGKVLGARGIGFGSTETQLPAPRIPAKLPLRTLLTVGSVGSSGLHYRLYAERDPDDSGVTVAAIPLSDLEQTLHRLLLVEALVIAAALLALGMTAFFVVRIGLRPLTRIETTAGQIAHGDLSRRVSPASEKTEVGRLGLALNAMLDRLEQAFRARTASEERLRRFLADASHELRTPLASIRGYAELFRMGATREGEDTELAMRRIEEESKRMGVLVEDLLTLARLDSEPERELGPVDLAALAGDAVLDGRARAPEREFTLSAPEHATVQGDPLQLRQVFANLVGNAIAHTPPGTPVEVNVESHDDAVTLAVRDHGPGISPEAREHLFERFWRRERGRERARGGAGLGLAIVHGVVLAHHGKIEVRDTPGGGAEFLVSLPAAATGRPAEVPLHA